MALFPRQNNRGTPVSRQSTRGGKGQVFTGDTQQVQEDAATRTAGGGSTIFPSANTRGVIQINADQLAGGGSPLFPGGARRGEPAIPGTGGGEVDITVDTTFDNDTRVLTTDVSGVTDTVVIPGGEDDTSVLPITNTTAFADAQRWYDENNHIFTVVATNVPLEDPTVAAGTGYIEIENIGLDLRKGALDMRQIPRGIHLRG